MEINSHPVKVVKVADEGFYANSHPYKVVFEGGGGSEGRVVDELPETGEPGYIYLVLKEETSEGNIYDEYMWVLQQDGETYGWEHIGVTNEVKIEIDDAISSTSENAVQNKAIKSYVDNAIASIDSGIPTTATFWGQPYNATSDRVSGDIELAPRTSYIRFGSSTGQQRNNYIGADANTQLRISNQQNISFSASGIIKLEIRHGTSNGDILAWSAIDMSGGQGASWKHQIKMLAEPTDGTDATTKNYTDNLVINYSALNGASAPTTATEGKYIGQLYYDTTNEQLYFLKEIDDTTTPVTYTWEAIGGGSSVNVVQTLGTSTTDVMSQNAVRDALYQPNTSSSPFRAIQIGDGATYSQMVTSGVPILIGNNATIEVSRGGSGSNVVIGGTATATATAQRSVAIGYGSKTDRQQEFSIGGTSYINDVGGIRGRYLAYVLDPQNDSDGANKRYVDTSIANAISGITGVQFEVVATLPATGDAGTIYLVPNSGTTPNIYDEYIYVNNAFEKIGTTEIDLSNYVTNSALQTALLDKADVSDIPANTSDLTNDGADGTSTYAEMTDIENDVEVGSTIATPSSVAVVSTTNIQDGAVTAAKLGNDVNFLQLTMSTTDIGEGATLAANNLYGVYEENN